jgi:hypothetical protein
MALRTLRVFAAVVLALASFGVDSAAAVGPVSESGFSADDNAALVPVLTMHTTGDGLVANAAAAAALGSLNIVSPSFIPFRPTVFLRPFSIDDAD